MEPDRSRSVIGRTERRWTADHADSRRSEAIRGDHLVKLARPGSKLALLALAVPLTGCGALLASGRQYGSPHRSFLPSDRRSLRGPLSRSRDHRPRDRGLVTDTACQDMRRFAESLPQQNSSKPKEAKLLNEWRPGTMPVKPLRPRPKFSIDAPTQSLNSADQS